MKPYRKIYLSFLAFIALTLTYSCEDFLEKPDSTGLTEDVVFSTIEDAEKVLLGAYAFPEWGYVITGDPWTLGAMMNKSTTASMCDEAENGNKAGQVHTLYQQGMLTSDIVSNLYPWSEHKWIFDFQAIRSAYLFINNIDRVVESPSDEYIQTRVAEAYGIIAQKYHRMFMRYGGMPWINQYVNPGDEMSYERQSIQATADSIVHMLDTKVIPFLPERHPSSGFTRINKIAAMMVKAKTLLWSASPLFNPSDGQSYYPSYGKQEYIVHESYDVERWKLAADAAKEAIDAAEAAGYGLYNDPNLTPSENYKRAVMEFPESFTEETSGNVVAGNNPEIIWGTRLSPSYATGQGFAYCGVPYSSGNFNTRQPPPTLPTQSFVDNYEMITGSYQPDNYYATSSNPYANIDKRFHGTILYHGGPFGQHTMDMIGDNNPGTKQNFTGYNLHKFYSVDYMSESNGAAHGNRPESFWPYLRMAELYLIYAEALNEYDYASNKTEVLDAINLVRSRAGQPPLQFTPQFEDTQEHVRDRIIRERAVELAFEEKRYFDLKRWKLGHEHIGGSVEYMSVSGTQASPSFTITYLEDRVFTDKWYLFPFPKHEIQTAKGFVQNPGW